MSNTENRSPVSSLYLNALVAATSPGATKEQRQAIVAWRGNPDGTSEVAFVWFDRTTGLVKKDKHGNPMLIWRPSQRQSVAQPQNQLAAMLQAVMAMAAQTGAVMNPEHYATPAVAGRYPGEEPATRQPTPYRIPGKEPVAPPAAMDPASIKNMLEAAGIKL